MTIDPPITSFGFQARRLTVRLSGRSLRSGDAFHAELHLDAGRASYHAERRVEDEERIQLEISANFRPDKWTRAGVEVTGFLGLEVGFSTFKGLDVQIHHRMGTGKNCHLICFENSETSEGPCLTCPDGEYFIRICC